MKRIFTYCILYFWGLGVVIPYISLLIFGIFNTQLYTDIPDIYLHKTALVETIVVFTSLIIIRMLPIGNGIIIPKYRIGGWYIYFWLIYYIIGRLRLGNGSIAAAFEATAAGAVNGTLIAYLGLFCDLMYMVFVYFLCVKGKVNYIAIIILYAIYTILCSSRSGLLTIIFILGLTLFVSDKFKNNRKKICLIIFICMLCAPLIFVLSTKNRNSSSGGTYKEVINTIVGRCSQLELGGLALYKYENDSWDEEVFERKYAFDSQMKLIVNSLIPGDMFESDVDPNQYYRTVFLNMPEEEAYNNYTSMNLTLPIYLRLKYGTFLGIGISIIILVVWYVLCSSIKNQVIQVLFAIGVRDILIFFDWVMIGRLLLTMLLTAIVFNGVVLLSRSKRLNMKNNMRIYKTKIKLIK